MFISNTSFNVHHRWRYTWMSPGDRALNQIDFIFVKSHFRNSVKNLCSYPGANMDLDRNLVLLKFKLSRKQIEKPKPNPKLDLSELQNVEACDKFKAEVLKKLPVVSPTNTNDHWEAITPTIQQVATNNRILNKGFKKKCKQAK